MAALLGVENPRSARSFRAKARKLWWADAVTPWHEVCRAYQDHPPKLARGQQVCGIARSRRRRGAVSKVQPFFFFGGGVGEQKWRKRGGGVERLFFFGWFIFNCFSFFWNLFQFLFFSFLTFSSISSNLHIVLPFSLPPCLASLLASLLAYLLASFLSSFILFSFLFFFCLGWLFLFFSFLSSLFVFGLPFLLLLFVTFFSLKKERVCVYVRAAKKAHSTCNFFSCLSTLSKDWKECI